MATSVAQVSSDRARTSARAGPGRLPARRVVRCCSPPGQGSGSTPRSRQGTGGSRADQPRGRRQPLRNASVSPAAAMNDSAEKGCDAAFGRQEASRATAPTPRRPSSQAVTASTVQHQRDRDESRRPRRRAAGRVYYPDIAAVHGRRWTRSATAPSASSCPEKRQAPDHELAQQRRGEPRGRASMTPGLACVSRSARTDTPPAARAPLPSIAGPTLPRAEGTAGCSPADVPAVPVVVPESNPCVAKRCARYACAASQLCPACRRPKPQPTEATPGGEDRRRRPPVDESQRGMARPHAPQVRLRR